jgi:hypothetical protein
MFVIMQSWNNCEEQARLDKKAGTQDLPGEDLGSP